MKKLIFSFIFLTFCIFGVSAGCGEIVEDHLVLSGNWGEGFYAENHENYDSENVTLEAWVYMNEANVNNAIIHKAYTSSHVAPYYQYWLDVDYSGGFIIYFSGALDGVYRPLVTKMGASLSWNNWYHLVATFDGTTSIIYINGEEVQRDSTYSGKLCTSCTQPLYIGDTNYLNGYEFDGKIDEARIYSQALTALEIRDSYQRGLANLPSNVPTIYLSGYWSFDEGGLDSVTGNTGTFVDNAHVSTDCPEENIPYDSSGLEERIEILEQKVEALENKTTWLESIINKILDYFNFMPYLIKRQVLCNVLEETGETQITDLGLSCEIKQLGRREKCVCSEN